LCEIVFGKEIHPLTLDLLGALVLPFASQRVFGLDSSLSPRSRPFLFSPAPVFSGAGNGIARGTMPLDLFDHPTYGAFTGRLLAPSLILPAFCASHLRFRHRTLWPTRGALG
jgi:hypothetical protein